MNTRAILAAIAIAASTLTLAPAAQAASPDKHCSDVWCKAPAQPESDKLPMYNCAAHSDYVPVKGADGYVRNSNWTECYPSPYISRTATIQLYQSHQGGPFYKAGPLSVNNSVAEWIWAGPAKASCVAGVTRQWKAFVYVKGTWFSGGTPSSDAAWTSTVTLNC